MTQTPQEALILTQMASMSAPAKPVLFTAGELTDLRTLCARAAYDSADDARNDAQRHLVNYNILGALLDNMTAAGASVAIITPHIR